MSESITQLTNELIASYAKVRGINHLDGGNLPSKFAIASITTDLLRLLLPGFFDEKPFGFIQKNRRFFPKKPIGFL